MAEPILVVPNQVIAGPDWDALVTQHGGTKGPPTPRPPSKTEQATADDAGDDLTQNPIYRQYLADGTYVEYRKAPNGTDSQIVDYKPSAKFTQQQTRQDQGTGPPGGKAYIDEEGPNGRRLGWNPETHQYDRDLGSSPSAQAGAQAAANPATATGRVPVTGYPGIFEVKSVKKDPATNAQTEETHYENEAGQTVPDPHPAAGATKPTRSETEDPKYPGWKHIHTDDGKGNVEDYWTDKDGKRGTPQGATSTSSADDAEHPGYRIVKETRPDGSSDTYTVNEKGERVAPPGKAPERVQDPTTKQWLERQPDGTWKPMTVQGASGAAKGPPAPEIVAGHASEALRIYQQQLMNDPTLSAAQREVLWNQAIQMATTTYNEATQLEGARQADQTAAVSLSNSRLSNATSGFNTALEATIHVNDRLPPGSNLGGKMFLGLLGIQMQHAHDMGAYDAGPTPQMRPTQFGERPQPVPGASPAPVSPPAAPSADAAQAEADRQRAAAESAAGGPPPEQPPAPEAPAPAAPPAPPPPMPSETPAPAPFTPGADPSAPVGQVTADPATFAVLAPMAAPSAPAMEPTASPDDFALLKGQFPTPNPPPALIGGDTEAGPQVYPPPNGMSVPPFDDGRGYDNPALRPLPVRRVEVDGPPDMMRAPLGAADPRATPPGAVGAPDAPVSEPPVLLHARAAVTPPWRITPALYQRMRAAGVPDSVIFSIPGFSGSGASSEGFAGSTIA